MRADNASTVQWILNCKGSKDDVRAGSRGGYSECLK